jgi:hypothetical protein
MYSQTGMSSNWLRFPASRFPRFTRCLLVGFVLSAVSTLTAGTRRPHLPASRGGTIRAGVALTPGAAKDPGLPPARAGPPPGVVPGGGPGASPGEGDASAGIGPNDASRFNGTADPQFACFTSGVSALTFLHSFRPLSYAKPVGSGRARAE